MDVSWIKREHEKEGEPGVGDGGENEGREDGEEGNFRLLLAEVSPASLAPTYLPPSGAAEEILDPDGMDSDGFIEVESDRESSKASPEEVGDSSSGSEDPSEEEVEIETVGLLNTAHLLPEQPGNSVGVLGNSVNTPGNSVDNPANSVDSLNNSADDDDDGDELYTTFTRRDTGGPAFKCKECCKCFARRSDMVRHVVIHMRAENGTSLRHPKKCATYTALSGRQCQHGPDASVGLLPSLIPDTLRAQSPKLDASMSEAAETPTSFRCHKCSKVFGLKSSLRFHLLEHGVKMPNKNVNNCDVCRKVFGRPSKLQRHLRTRSHIENVQRTMQDAVGGTDIQVVGEAPSEQVNLSTSSQQGKDIYPMHLTLAKPNTVDLPVEKQRFDAVPAVTNVETAVHALPQGKAVQETSKPPMPLSRRARPCVVCGKYITNMTVHMRTHTGERPFKCKVCGKAFPDNGGVKRHMLTHTGHRPYKCHICFKTFTQSSTCRIHMSIHGVTRKHFKYQCELCPAIFAERSLLRKHKKHEHNRKGRKKRRHKDRQAREAKLLNKARSRYSSKQATNQFAASKSPPQYVNSREVSSKLAMGRRRQLKQCLQCGELTPNLFVHMRTHSGKPTYSCEICSKLFGGLYDLERHMRTHTGEKPFKCPLCPAKFTQKSSLRIHMVKHGPEYESYSDCICSICYKLCGSTSRLKLHMQLCHAQRRRLQLKKVSVGRPFVLKAKRLPLCEACGIAFQTKREFQIHLTSAHSQKRAKESAKSSKDGELQANNSCQENGRERDLDVSADESSCKIEPEDTPVKSRKKMTAKGKSNVKPFHMCAICFRVFRSKHKLLLHEDSHAKHRPYQCELCSKAFTQKSSLKVHMAVHGPQYSYYTQFACQFCGKKFVGKSKLKRHIHCVHRKKQAKSTTFTLSKARSRRRKYNVSTKKNKGMKLESLSNQTLQEGETFSDVWRAKNYKCQHCEETFSDEQSLTAHQQVHPVDKLFKCPMCAKGFINQGLQERHMARIHGEEKPFQCEQCLECFETKSELEVHETAHVGGTSKCEQLKENKINQPGMKNRKQTHVADSLSEHKCKMCSSSFVVKQDLEEHLACNAVQSTANCKSCSEQFSSQCELLKHQKLHAEEAQPSSRKVFVECVMQSSDTIACAEEESDKGCSSDDDEGTNQTSERTAVINMAQIDVQDTLSEAAGNRDASASDSQHDKEMAAAMAGLAAANLCETGEELEAEWKDVLVDYFCSSSTSNCEVVKSNSRDGDYNHSHRCEGEFGNADGDAEAEELGESRSDQAEPQSHDFGRGSASVMESRLDAWDSCRCTRKCKTLFAPREILDHQCQILSLTRAEKDIAIMAQLNAMQDCTASSGCAKPAEKEEQGHVCTRYFFHRKDICLDMFVFLNSISFGKLQRLKKVLKKYGLFKGVLMLRKPAAAMSKNFGPEEIRSTVQFITNYAEEWAVLLPGCIPRCKTSDISLLPNSVSRLSLHKQYLAASRQNGSRAMPYTTFCRVWRQHVPSVVTAKPGTDLCPTCQQNATAILRSANESEKFKLGIVRLYRHHINDMQNGIDHYREETAAARLSIKEDPADFGTHSPCSRTGKMHYSFGFTQQLHYPADPQRPGPVGFLTSRKCGIFGINCEGIPKQVNFLIDEGVRHAESSVAILSYLHHFFQHFGLGEKMVSLHCDSPSGQTRNQFLLWYLAWRCISGLHEVIMLDFVVASHATFAPQYCFGLLKRKFRSSVVSTLADIVRVVETSSARGVNVTQLVGDEEGRQQVPSYAWDEFFSPHFKPFPDIESFHHFRFSNSEPGVVYCREFASSQEKKFLLLKPDISLPHTLPPPIPAPGLSLDRQRYLHTKIRPFCRPDARDATCPSPKSEGPNSLDAQSNLLTKIQPLCGP